MATMRRELLASLRVSMDWLSMKPLVAVIGSIAVFMLLWSIYELEEHLRPDEPATWTRIAFLLLIVPTIVLVWWGIQ